ncbi:MAG TPA: hypothetical protein DDX98_15505 [Bacteroidales bacterium]|jgi:hypothetical protein|nr:hypothetical protein [Bacteroidales bacterium]
MKNVALILISFTLVFASCETEEGKGGTSTIRGTVTVWEYNKDLTIKLGEYSAQEVDVYIIYGDDPIYGDRFRTGYDGKYEFNYLQEGNYTIYALSKDTTNFATNELIPVFKEVSISGKNKTIEVPEIIIID